MQRRLSPSVLAAMIFGMLMSIPGPARAQLDLTLLSSSETVGIGGTATFTGTIANLSGQPVQFLNGLDIGVDGGLFVDPAPFGLPESLSGGESFTGTLFTVTIPGGTLPGLYTGTLTLIGGTDTSAADPLTPVTPFSVNVLATSVAPEPPSLFLLLVAGASPLAGAARSFRRRSHPRLAKIRLA